MTRAISIRPQRGGALFLLLGIIALAFGWRWFSTPPAIARDAITLQALAEARQTLINWSVQRRGAGGSGGSNYARPGALPCPDLHQPQSDSAGYVGNDKAATCSTQTSRLGRMPWRSLQHADVKDGAGETLWLAVAEPFNDSDNAVLNPDTPGLWFSAFDAAAKVALSNAADPPVALILAPGAALAAQSRLTPAERIKPTSYLEKATLAGIKYSNVDASVTPFISGPLADQTGKLLLNDRIAVIRRSDLMLPIEARVARQYQQLLAWWAAAHNGDLPHPAAPADPECTRQEGATNQLGCEPEPPRCSGRLPKSSWLINELDKDVDASLLSEAMWLYRNRWEQQFYYAVSGDAACPSALHIAATAGVVDSRAVMISSGVAQPGQHRDTALARSQLENYLEPIAAWHHPTAGVVMPDINQRGWSEASVTWLAAPAGNDRMYRYEEGSADGQAQWLLTR